MELNKMENKKEIANKKQIVAMPIPLVIPETNVNYGTKMREQGLYFVENMLDKLPHSTKAQTQNTLQEIVQSGAGEIFEKLDVKSALSLPVIVNKDENKLVEILGELFYVIDVIEPREVKRKSTINGKEYAKGDFYEGEIILLNANNGNIEVKNYTEVADKIIKPTDVKRQMIQNLNEQIESWNKRVESLQNALGVTRINLQIFWAVDQIQKRLAVLENQEKSLQEKIDNPQSAFSSHEEFIGFLNQSIKEGRLNAIDTFDTLMFLYQSIPSDLIAKIESGEIQLDPKVKPVVLALAIQEAKARSEYENKEESDRTEREQKQDEEWEMDEGLTEEPLDKIREEDVRDSSYVKPNKYRSVHTLVSSFENAVASIRRDIKELKIVQSALSELAAHTASLEQGQRSMDYLRSEDGRVIVEAMKNFLDKAKLFVKRYKIDIFDENNKINKKLFGIHGSAGNSFIAAALNRICVVIYGTIKDIIKKESVEIPQEHDIPSETTEAKGVEAKTDTRMKNYSNSLWNGFFKDFLDE
jgi:chaperonin cofactor prefoldin